MTQINPKQIIEQGIISNIANQSEQLQQVGIDLTIKEDVILYNGECKNVEFNEKFDMKDCFAIFNVRSSFSRQGVFVSTGIYDPGFKGTGGCTIYNMAAGRIELKKGERIGQMICFKADAASSYDGHYNKSNSIDSQYEVNKIGKN